jgi:small subunit ribosomal protein S6
MLNIECDGETLGELENTFRFNDAVIRHLVIRCDKAASEPSPLAKNDEKEGAAS